MSTKRTLEEFVRDYNRTKKVLRPNPDWEEDLMQTVVVTPEIEARIKTYTQFKPKKPKAECFCQEGVSSPGVAPVIEMNDGKTIPSFGLGTWLGWDETGERIKGPTDDTMQKAVEMAIDAGYRHIDTAARYNTEQQVGIAIKNKIAEGVVARDDIFVTTKLWNDCHAKKDVLPALKESLAKLDLDYLDLYLIHWPVAQYEDGRYYDADYLETWEGMILARDLGLVKSIGVCNFNINQLQRLITMSSVKPAALQIEVNLNIQQEELIQFCKTHKIAVIGYTPFGSLLHNKAAPGAPPPRTDEQALLRIADRHHKTVAQVALRYLVELGVIPIPKSVNKQRIEANIEVFDFQLNQMERNVMKKYDVNYRTMAFTKWKDSPFYPFTK